MSILPYVSPDGVLDTENNVLNRETQILRYDVNWGRPYAALDYAQIVIGSNPLGYWRMTTDALSVLNYGYTGSTFNGSWPAADIPIGVSSAVGLCDGAASLNGTSQYLLCGAVPFGGTTYEFSFSGWVNFNPAGISGLARTIVAGKLATGSDIGGWRIVIINSIVSVEVYSGGSWKTVLTAAKALLQNRWTFIGVSYRAGAQSLLIDDQTIVTATSAFMPTEGSENFYIGAQMNGASPYHTGSITLFQGGIDEVAVYKTGVTVGTLQEQFRRGVRQSYYEPAQDVETAPVSFNTLPGIDYKTLQDRLLPYYYWGMDESAGTVPAVNRGSKTISTSYIGADIATSVVKPGATVDDISNPVCRKFSGRTSGGGFYESTMKTNAALDLGTAGSRTAFSIAFWYKGSALSRNWDDVCGIFNMRAQQHGFAIRVNRSRISFSMPIGSNDYSVTCLDGSIVLDPLGLGRDTWYHIAFTVSSAGRIRCFINGQSNGADSYTRDGKGMRVPSNDLTNAYFKVGKLSNGDPHPGFMMDELCILAKEISSAQIYELYMNGRYGSTYGTRLISQGSDGVTENTYGITCNELSQLINEQDITSMVTDWSIDLDDKKFIESAVLQMHEDWGFNDIESILQPNTYVIIRDRMANVLDHKDTGWHDVGHFLVEGAGTYSEDGSGSIGTQVILRGVMKLLALDLIPTKTFEPDRLFVSKRPLTLVGIPATFYTFQCPRAEDPTTYYSNWVDQPSVRFWVTKLTKFSNTPNDARRPNDLYRIKGAQGSVQVFGGEGSIHIDKEFYEAAIKDVGLGQPATSGGVLAEFFRFCAPQDVTPNVLVQGSGFDGRYYLRVTDDNREDRDKTLFMQTGAAAGKMYKIIDERSAFVDGGGNLGNYDSGIAQGVFKTWSSATRAGSTYAWNNPASAKYGDADFAYTQAPHDSSTHPTHYLKAVDPEWDSYIPAGATITSIKVIITRKANVTNNTSAFSITTTSYGGESIKDKELFLVKGGAVQTGATNKAATGAAWPWTPLEGADASYGGSIADLWGVALADTDLGSGFGVALACDVVTSAGGSNYVGAAVDSMRIEVGWELWTPEGGGTAAKVQGSADSKFMLAYSEGAYGALSFRDWNNILLKDERYSSSDLRPAGGAPVVTSVDSKAVRAMRPMDDLFTKIPVGAQLTGIEITIRRSGNVLRSDQSGGYAYNWVEDKQVQLVIGGHLGVPYDVDLYGSNKAKTGYANSWGGPSDGGLHGTAPFVPGFTEIKYGGPTDLWGLDTDPGTAFIAHDPFTILGQGPHPSPYRFFGVQVAATAKFENSRWVPYMEARIESITMTVYWGVAAGGGGTGGDGSSGNYSDSGYKKIYLQGPFGHMISPLYEGIAGGDRVQIGDCNSIDFAITKALLYNGFQIRDSSKPFYFQIDPPQIPDGSTLPPAKFKLSDMKLWQDLVADVMSVAPPNYVLATFPDGITRTQNVVQKPLGSADFISPSFESLAVDGTDFAVYTRVVAEGIGGDSINVAAHQDYAGQAAVRAYRLTNYYNPSNSGLDEGQTLTQTQANAVIKQIFDNSAKSPGPGNPTPNTGDLNYGLIYQFSSTAVRRWTMEDTDLFVLDIGKNTSIGQMYEIDAFQMVFVDTYRQDKGGRKVPQALRLDYMTEEDYVLEFGKHPPEVPDQTNCDSKPNYMSSLNLNDANATYMPPSNARSWKQLADEFNCQDGQFTIESDAFLTGMPTKFRFLRVRVTQAHYAYAFGATGTGTYDGGNATAVARVNIADIKLWTSRRIIAVSELGSAPSVDTGAHKKLAQLLRRRTYYTPQNPYLDTFDKAQRYANGEIIERYREFRPRAVSFVGPSVFLGQTGEFYDPRLASKNNYVIRALTKFRDGRINAQITDFNALPQGVNIPVFSANAIAGLQLWVDAGTVVQSGGILSSWTDLSGYLRHPIPAGSSNRPVNNLTMQNGFPVVHADGTDDQLRFPDITLTDWTIIVVGKVSVPGQNVVFVGNYAANIQAARLDDGGPIMKTYDGMETHASTSTVTGFAVYAFTRSGGAGGTYSFFRNGEQLTTLFGGGGDVANITVNCLWQGIDGFAASDNLSFLIYDHAVSAAELAYLTTGLRARFGV